MEISSNDAFVTFNKNVDLVFDFMTRNYSKWKSTSYIISLQQEFEQKIRLAQRHDNALFIHRI